VIRLALPKTSLALGESIVLSVEKTHYLKNVMRLKMGDCFLTLDGMNGLFETLIVSFDRRHQAICRIERCIEKYQDPTYELVLLFSPIKNIEWLLQKATVSSG
jgi:16S rRNA U1498 N3-methylase RsmE